MRHINTYGRVYYATAIIVSILFALIYAYTPAGADDLLFLCTHNADATFGQSLGEIAQTISHRWTTESGRLGTFVSIVFLFLDAHILFSILSGVIVLLLLVLACCAVNVRPGSVLSWLLMAAIVFAMPWYDYLFLCSYGLNYVWSSMLALAAVYVLMNLYKYTKRNMTGVCLLLFLAGWMHEAYGVPLCIASFGMFLGQKTLWHGKNMAALLSLCIGTSITFLSRAFWNRTGGGMLISEFPLHEFVIQLGPSIIFLLLFITALCGCLVTSKRRESLRTVFPQVLFFTLFIVTSAAITFRYYNGARSSMPLLLMCVVGAAYLFNVYMCDAARWLKTAVTIFVPLLCISHLTYTVCYQHVLRKEYFDIVSRFKKSPTGAFYYDVTYPSVDFSLLKTSVRQFHERIPIWMWESYHNGTEGQKHLQILPTDIANFHGTGIPSEYVNGAQIYNGWAILDSENTLGESKPGLLRLHTDDGSTIISRFRLEPFVASDGNAYVLVIPHAKIMNKSLIIKDISLTQ